MYVLVQYNVLTPEVKKAGAPHLRFLCHSWGMLGFGGMQAEGRTLAWVPTWSELLGVGGFDPVRRGMFRDQRCLDI